MQTLHCPYIAPYIALYVVPYIAPMLHCLYVAPTLKFEAYFEVLYHYKWLTVSVI